MAIPAIGQQYLLCPPATAEGRPYQRWLRRIWIGVLEPFEN